MTRSWIVALFVASGLFASTGVTWTILESAAQTGADASSLEPPENSHQRVGSDNFADLWTGRGASHPTTDDPAKLEKMWMHAVRTSHTADSTIRAQLRNEARANTAALKSLMHKLEREQDPGLRELLKSILFGIEKPELVAFAVKLTESSTPLHKMEGFDLLGQLTIGERQLRQAALKALASENDPVVLRHVVMALDPKSATPLETAEVTRKLHHLAQHADIGVRRQSIELLARWDRTTNMENLLEQALADPAVRLAAINVLYESPLRSDTIKLALLNVARGDHDFIGNSALDVLAKFDLTSEEREFHRQRRAGGR